MGNEVDVVVVGAGLAGATAARRMAEAGLRLQVLDKGRGPGGRLSTRRAESGTFDHGAASLQAASDPFRAWLEENVDAGRAARLEEREWVGQPGMNALVAGLLEGLAPRWGTAVAGLRRTGGRWQALDAEGRELAVAPRLLLAVPAPQARGLLAEAMDASARGDTGSDIDAQAWRSLDVALAAVRYAPCWAAMVQTAPEVDATSGAADLASGGIGGRCLLTRPDGPLERIIRESSKPGRRAGHWVVHARAAWSEAHLELAPEQVAAALRDAFVDALALAPAAVLAVTPHRWRYAVPTCGIALSGLPSFGLHLAGDAVGWRDDGVPAAERAWRSGQDAAAAIIAGGRQPKS